MSEVDSNLISAWVVPSFSRMHSDGVQDGRYDTRPLLAGKCGQKLAFH